MANDNGVLKPICCTDISRYIKSLSLLFFFCIISCSMLPNWVEGVAGITFACSWHVAMLKRIWSVSFKRLFRIPFWSELRVKESNLACSKKKERTQFKNLCRLHEPLINKLRYVLVSCSAHERKTFVEENNSRFLVFHFCVYFFCSLWSWKHDRRTNRKETSAGNVSQQCSFLAG